MKTTLNRVPFFVIVFLNSQLVVNITLACENITHRQVNITRTANIIFFVFHIKKCNNRVREMKNAKEPFVTANTAITTAIIA